MIAFLIRIPCDSAISLFRSNYYSKKNIFKKYTDKQKIVMYYYLIVWIGCCAGIIRIK